LITTAEANGDDTTNLESDLATAQGETENLRTAKTTAKDALAPVLLAQGLDDMYAREGEEFIAWENYNAVVTELEARREAYAEAEQELPDVEEVYYTAQYELDFANSREEWEAASEAFAAAEARFNAVNDRLNESQNRIGELEGEEGDLETIYNDSVTAREEQAQKLKDEANVDVPAYDAREGPPTLPEEEETDDSTAGGSETTEP